MAKITSNIKDVTYTLELSTDEAALIMSLLGAVGGDIHKTYRVDTYPLYETLRKAEPPIPQLVITDCSLRLKKLPLKRLL